MKGDFTRFTHNPTKHYTEVLKQQGRVDLDADWNEYVSIQGYLNQTRARDIIGFCGVPETGGGFKIGVTTDGRDLTISSGRIYVNGLLCQLEAEARYTEQADYKEPPTIGPQEGRTDLVYLDVWQRYITAVEDPDIREVALGGLDTATRVKTVCQVKILTGVGDVSCSDEIEGWPPSRSGGELSTEVVPTPEAEEPCEIAAGGGYRGLENRLYRVEIHKAGDIGGANPATFKWSRDNGSVVFAVEEFAPGEPTKIKVKRLGKDRVLALRKGDWVEVLGDETELKGVPGTLARIEDIDEAERVLTLSADVSTHNSEEHPKVRRWDQMSDAITLTASPIDLEDGIRIEFSGNSFNTGDYWVFAARTAIGDVERLVKAPPRGIEHHYCRLAVVKWHGKTADIRDCRKPFPPLTELPRSTTSRNGACLKRKEASH